MRSDLDDVSPQDFGPEECSMMIAVEDTGVGIAEDAMDKVFDPITHHLSPITYHQSPTTYHLSPIAHGQGL